MGLGGLSQRSHRSRPIIHYNPPPQHSWPDRGNAEAFYEFFAYVWQICIFCVYVWQICIFEAFIAGIQALGWAPFNSFYFSSVNWFRETILNTALLGVGYFSQPRGAYLSSLQPFWTFDRSQIWQHWGRRGGHKRKFQSFQISIRRRGPYLCTGLAS